ncbi:response regulator transcription factor [Xanthobacter sp. ZOL 2024]
MTTQPPTIHVVDDDPAIRKALSRLLAAVGYGRVLYESAEAFLSGYEPGGSGCILLDLDLPGMDGFGIQDALSAQGTALPVIFLTGTGDIPASVRAIKAGAVDFLAKPVDAATLLAAIEEALAIDSARRAVRSANADLRSCLDTLTPRERQVLDFVVRGWQNKQIAAELGTAVKTIKVHRARMMQKMGSPTLAELVRAMVESDPNTAHPRLKP